MKDLAKSLSKLNNPPRELNWVRYNHSDPVRMARQIANFVTGVPPFNLSPALKMIRDMLHFDVGVDVAVKAVSRVGNPVGHMSNKEVVKAFDLFSKERQYGPVVPFQDPQAFFQVSRELRVPVRPLTFLNEDGMLLPLFVCGWADIPLDHFQRRLLMTIIEDSLMTQADLVSSPCELVFLPKGDSEDGTRNPEIWRRGEYTLLTRGELKEHMDQFVQAKQEAELIVREKFRKWAEEGKRVNTGDHKTDDDPNQPKFDL